VEKKKNIHCHESCDDNEYWTHLQSLSQSFTRLGVELVPSQVEIRETLVHLRVEKKLQQIKKITFGVIMRESDNIEHGKFTSSDFATAFPPSGPRLLSYKLSLVRVLFTCIIKRENENINLGVLTVQRCR
jgi:hypothetical protein